MSSGAIDKNNYNGESEDNYSNNFSKKKSNIHGRIKKENQTGLLEVTYYECDDIVCQRREIKKK